MNQDFSEASRHLNPEIYERFKSAVERGKWPDGRRLTAEQREICMQAMINYEAAHLKEEQRTGFMPQKCASDKPGKLDVFASFKTN